MKKRAHSALTAMVVSLFAASAGASSSILAEINFSGTAGAAFPVNASPILTTDSQFTVFNAALSTNGVKVFGVGGTLSTATWLYDSTGTAARNTDLYTVSNYAGATRLDMSLGLATAGQTYTIDLSNEGLTATDSTTAWTVAQGLRFLFYQPTGATADDGFQVDAIRFLTGTTKKFNYL